MEAQLRTEASFFFESVRSMGLARCSFIPAAMAFCRSSSNAFAVMAMRGSDFLSGGRALPRRAGTGENYSSFARRSAIMASYSASVSSTLGRLSLKGWPQLTPPLYLGTMCTCTWGMPSP